MDSDLAAHQSEFENFNTPNARKILRRLESSGKVWLKRFNTKHVQAFNKAYIEKNGITDKIVEEIDPIIRNELKEYLEHASDEFINDLSKEIRNKIQDKLIACLDLH